MQVSLAPTHVSPLVGRLAGDTFECQSVTKEVATITKEVSTITKETKLYFSKLCEGRSQGGLKGRRLEVGAPKLLVPHICHFVVR